MTSASRRVQTTSYASATKPEMAAAVYARRGLGDGVIDRTCFALFFGGPSVRAPRDAGEIAGGIAASQSAPAAASRFNTTPMDVEPRRPIVGMSQKPAAMAPIAAPAVFAAYTAPASAAVAPEAVLSANHAAASGKVAPIAAAGMPSSSRLSATRTAAKRNGAVASAYAHASAGTQAASPSGN